MEVCLRHLQLILFFAWDQENRSHFQHYADHVYTKHAIKNVLLIIPLIQVNNNKALDNE